MNNLNETTKLVKKAFDKATFSGDPKKIVKQKLLVLLKRGFYPTHLLSIGKGAIKMAEGVKDCNIHIPGIVLTNDENFKKLDGFNCYKSGHPIPDKRGFLAFKKIEFFLNSLKKNDHLLLLISGGGSALLPAPADGITLKQKVKINTILLNSGLDINQINSIRRLFSSMKGGKLALKAAPAKITQLLISDVPGDNLESIASGLASPDPISLNVTKNNIMKTKLANELFVKKYLDNIDKGKVSLPLKKENMVFKNVNSYIIASNSLCTKEIKSYLSKQLLVFDTLPPKLENEAAVMGKKLAQWIIQQQQQQQNTFFIVTGGETTVKISKDKKYHLGGRSQELALSFAIKMFEENPINFSWVILSAGTDGKDGPTDAAGAIISSNSNIKLSEAKMYLKNHNSYNYHKKINTLLKVKPTGTNLGDIVIIVIKKNK